MPLKPCPLYSQAALFCASERASAAPTESPQSPDEVGAAISNDQTHPLWQARNSARANNSVAILRLFQVWWCRQKAALLTRRRKECLKEMEHAARGHLNKFV